MTIINASLFAHIENDAHLSGTFKLEGNHFHNTVGYLKDYLTKKVNKESVSPKYLELLRDLEYLLKIEEQMDSIRESGLDLSNKIDALGGEIKEKLSHLDERQKILIPGGWHTKSGGHGMVYQFTRIGDDYHLTVFNSGAGLVGYHEKKSGLDKELYNPTKTWRFPVAKTEKDHTEIALFIGRLLKATARSLPENQKKPYSSKKLYEGTLASISYIGGEEIPGDQIPIHAYTGGQLSGTCAQRCIHQMLKINSSSDRDYERFIFEFKQHALFDYVYACLNQRTQPYTPSVKEQINLAIENNLKILNRPGVFSEDEIAFHSNEMQKIRERLKTTPYTMQGPSGEILDSIPLVGIIQYKSTKEEPNLTQPTYDNILLKPIDFHDGTNFLIRLAQAVTNIQEITNPAMQYYHLEELIAALPVDTLSDFYKEINLLSEHEIFDKQIDEIQKLLINLQKNWLRNAQCPAFNVMTLCVATLQMNIKNTIAVKKGLPSFQPFIEYTMQTLVGNKERDPFYATNHPMLDQKFKELQQLFPNIKEHKTAEDLCIYFKELLDTEPSLNEDLKREYRNQYGSETSELHELIRSKGLESLYMLSDNHKGQLPSKYNSLIGKIKAHIDYESQLRKALNPFFISTCETKPRLELTPSFLSHLYIDSPLKVACIGFEELSTTLSKNKYALQDSPARDALEADVANKATPLLEIRSANQIQLRPTKKGIDQETTSLITQEDIIARDYFHLRSEPLLQIPLTLDYFTRNFAKLSNESNQRYVEANLFQPGLLLNEHKKKNTTFFQQLDEFLKTGYLVFNKEGQYTRESLFFMYLNYQVSRYCSMTQEHLQEGKLRLQALQAQLLTQLTLSNTQEVTYVLQQHLFLTLMMRMELGEPSEELFSLAFQAYHYIQSHTNPSILEDISHRVNIEKAIAQFQITASQQSEEQIKKALNTTLEPQGLTLDSGQYPSYIVINQAGNKLEANILLGKLFEQGLTRAGIPFALQHHPLMRHLGLHHEQECLVSTNGTYMVLPRKTNKVHLFYENDQLTIQKEWTIQNISEIYELHPITSDHLAKQANSEFSTVGIHLPQILTDGTIDYWQKTNRNTGLLTQNNIPVYSIESGKIHVLDQKGSKTPYYLTSLNSLDKKLHTLIHQFEGNQFIVIHTAPSLHHTMVQLPRYNLNFEVHTNTNDKSWVHQETGEYIESCPSPIHKDVAGLVLTKNEYRRYLVPVARFYATTSGAKQGDFYPVVHDIHGTISQSILNDEWTSNPPEQKPLWNYQKSEQYVSFRMQDGEPIADTVADALYLAYIYLATNQPKKAWKILEECTTHFGGLTGDPSELKFISWICNDLPHLLPNTGEEAIKETPPYVACKLKAMNLMCNFFLQDRQFNLVAPERDNTANAHYALLEYKSLEYFQKALPETIYSTFSRLQSMRRHMKHHYTLSLMERKCLLDYYHQAQSKEDPPLGSLGYEWLHLSLETILQEKEALLARAQSGSLSKADKERLESIDNHLKQLKPVVAKSTALKWVPVNLELPPKSAIKRTDLTKTAIEILKQWENRLSIRQQFNIQELSQAIQTLSSKMSEEDILQHFPAYFHLALLEEDQEQRKHLLDFCTKTLIAHRHIPLDKQDSNIPLLCNILYRVAYNNKSVRNHFSETKLFLGSEIELQKLIDTVRQYDIPPLGVYQAKDVYKEILVTPQNILDRERPQHIPLVIPKLEHTSLLECKEIKEVLDQLNRKPLDELISRYNTIQKQGTQTITETSSEEETGTALFDLEQEQKKLAQAIMKQPELPQLIQQIINLKPIFLEKAQNTWEKALKLANQGPEDPKLAKKWHIERQSKARATLTQVDLIAMYRRSDVAFSVEKTGLNPEQTQQLHELIHQALFEDIQGQLVENVKDNLEKALQTHDLGFAVQLLDVLARESIPGLDKPATVIIQHEEEILLRTRQISALQSLLEHSEDHVGFKERIEKVIPGGGKSKVILPVVAEEKARGDNLVIIEVPPALLETNYVDFNRTSQRLFGKRAYRFDFNRDSNSSSKRLEQIYQQFTEAMTTRSYLVTTGEAMQSLELKYIELLSSQDRSEEWHKQIYWCDKITRLVRHHGDCIIDEVHQGLWIKKQLNYTSGESTPISPALIKNTIALFNFIDVAFIKKAPELPPEHDWGPFKINLATKMIQDKSSPLYQFAAGTLLRYGPEAQQKLIAYLTNTGEEMPEAVLHATPQEKEDLAFFKGQISQLLPETLRRKLNVDYGPSKRTQLSPVEYTLAIPYTGNDNPSEQSRFENEVEAMNLMVQMMLIKGISQELLKEQIIQYQALARQELFQNPKITHLDDTPTARSFALLDKEFTLSQINVNDSNQMAILFQRYQHYRTLITSLLQERTLNQIHYDGVIIHSDAFSHVDLYHSVQGLSGTPSNYTTFHQRLSYDPKPSLGTDDYIVEVLKSKKTQISTFDYLNVAQFMEEILTQSTEHKRVRAIIDINATFKGVSTTEVAQTISGFIRRQKTDYFSTPVKHVLYFNESQVLCALDVNKPEASPIVLGTSDEQEINRLLGSTPEERFTYYDQIHTLGTDIKQYDNAHSIVLADEQISFQSLIQGNMRMRGIAQSQTVELIVPTRLGEWTLQQLVDCLKKNDKQRLWLDNLFAAKAQMANLFRRTALSLIQDLPSEEAQRKAELREQFETFFATIPSHELFPMWGSINKTQKLEIILNRHQNQLLNLWKECCHKAKLLVDDEDKNIKNALEQIITKAIHNCLPEYEETEEAYGTEVQVQKEVQKEHQVKQELLKECYNPHLEEEGQVNWPANTKTNPFHSVMEQYTFTLNAICSSDPMLPSLFSDTLRVSKNYAQIYQGQKNYCNIYLKPVFLVWYHVEGNTLHATLVTPQEAEQLGERIKGSNSSQSWIATTQDTVVIGQRPEGMLHEARYQSLREQVRFFNGELGSLLSQETPLYWLNDGPDEKIAFFERTLQVYRPGCETELYQFKVALTQGNIEGFTYIAEHPFEDLRELHWKERYPKTTNSQVVAYQKVASAFAYLNENAIKTEISIDQIQQQFDLPFNSIGFVNDHLQHLLRIKTFLDRVKNNPNTPFLSNLSQEEQGIVECCMGMTLKDFYKHHLVPSSQSIEDPINSLVAGIKVLELMIFNHPIFKKEIAMTDYLIMLANQTDSPEVLCALLVKEASDKKLINTILNNSVCDESVIHVLFSLSYPFDNDMLIILAQRIKSKELAQQFLNLKNLTEDSLKTLVQNNSFLDEDQLMQIIDYTQNEQELQVVYTYPEKNAAIRQAVYTHNAFSNELLMPILNKGNLPDEDLLYLLRHSPVVGEQALIIIANNTTNVEILLAAISHSKMTSKIILNDLPIKHLIKIADEKILNVLVDSKKTGKFSKEILLLLARKCEQYGLIEQFLQRDDLDNVVLGIILNNYTLKEKHLLLVLQSAKDCNTLEQVYTHKEVTDTIRDKIYQHPSLSPEFIRSLLAKKELQNDMLLQILNHPTAITVEVLRDIVQGECNVLVLCKAVSHYHATKEVMSDAIDNGSFTPEIATLIMTQNKVLIEHELLKKLVKKIFAQMKTTGTPELWEPVLVTIFEQYATAKVEHASVEIMDVIKKQPVGAQLGLHILRIFGKPIWNHLPQQEMINKAQGSEINLLLDNNKTGRLSREHLELITAKCESGAQVSRLLARNDLTENALHIVFQKAPTYEHMQKILNHNVVSESTRKQWLEIMRANYMRLETEASESNDPAKLLVAALEKLKVKACSHALKAMTDKNYESAAQTALQLHQDLKKEHVSFLHKDIKPLEFQKNCEELIDKATPVLGEHRGYEQAFVDIINAILAVLTVYKLFQIPSGKWRFFEIKTASMEAVEQVKKSIGQSKHKNQNDGLN